MWKHVEKTGVGRPVDREHVWSRHYRPVHRFWVREHERLIHKNNNNLRRFNTFCRARAAILQETAEGTETFHTNPDIAFHNTYYPNTLALSVDLLARLSKADGCCGTHLLLTGLRLSLFGHLGVRVGLVLGLLNLFYWSR